MVLKSTLCAWGLLCSLSVRTLNQLNFLIHAGFVGEAEESGTVFREKG